MIRAVAALSLFYDGIAGAALLLYPTALPALFGLSLPDPRLFLHLNGVFLLAVATGYLLPYREPERYRAYLWVFGVGLKCGGAVVCLATYASQPALQRETALMLFAAADAVMALLSWMAVRTRI
jgi:hypothetical protein